MDLTMKPSTIVFFDTAPFIYFFENHPDYGRIVDNLLQSIYENDSSFITSYITYIELISKPRKLGREDLVAKYREFFTNSDNLSLYPLNLIVSEKTAEIRAAYDFKTPDAIQIATAVTCGADLIVTNDKEWKKFREIPMKILSE